MARRATEVHIKSAIALPHLAAMLDLASEQPRGDDDVLLDSISRRNDTFGTIRNGACPFAGRTESARLGIARGHQRRRFRHGMVRGTPRARALSRGPAGLVGREFTLSLPPHSVAPLFRACARGDRHGDHAGELPSLRLRPLAVPPYPPHLQLPPLPPQYPS